MTLVIASKWMFNEGEAILITCDSRATTPIGIMYEVKKAYPIMIGEEPIAIASGAGDPSLIKWGFEEAEEILKSYARRNYPLNFEDFRNAIRDIEYSFMKRFSEIRSYGLKPSFQMVIGSVDLNGKASLYLFDDNGLAEPVHDNPGYAIIGSGFITGALLLLRLLGYSMDLDLGMLSTFIIDLVSEVDTSVGPFIGESYLMRIEIKNGKKTLALGPLKLEALREYKNKVVKRKEIIKEIWKIFDEIGEEEIEKMINDLKNKIKGEKNEHK